MKQIKTKIIDGVIRPSEKLPEKHYVIVDDDFYYCYSNQELDDFNKHYNECNTVKNGKPVNNIVSLFNNCSQEDIAEIRNLLKIKE